MHGLILPLCLIQAMNLNAAALPLEDSVFSEDSRLSFDPEIPDTPPPDNEEINPSPLSAGSQTKPPTNPLYRNENADQFFQSPAFGRTKHSTSVDIIKQSYGKLNEIVDDESLDDAVLIIKSINADLNNLNQKIEQKIAPAIEDLFIMQRLLPGSTEQQLPASYQTRHFPAVDLSTGDPLHNPELNGIVYEQPSGFFALLIKLPTYLFDIENLIILGVSLFLLTGLFKIVHYVVNRIY